MFSQYRLNLNTDTVINTNINITRFFRMVSSKQQTYSLSQTRWLDQVDKQVGLHLSDLAAALWEVFAELVNAQPRLQAERE